MAAIHSDSTTKQKIVNELQTTGFAVLRGALDPAECKTMAAELENIERQQREKSSTFVDEQRCILWHVHQSHPDLFLKLVDLPAVLEIAQAVLKEAIILGSFGAIRNQSAEHKNNVHIDSRVAMPDFQNTFQLIAMYCITDFTAQNGSTYLWPLSHLSGLNPKEVHPPGSSPVGKVQCEAKAGDVIIFLGQTWHDVAPNFTQDKRWGILAYYHRWWVKPSFDYSQCGPELFKKLSPQQKSLFGFTSRPPGPVAARLNTCTNIADLPDDYESALKS